MKVRWYLALFAALPYAAMLLTVQSCGGEGGPAGGGGGGTGGGSFSSEFLALMSNEQKSATAIGSEACAPCHGGKASDPVYTTWHDTKHASVGVGCERCHGNGSVHQANPTKDNIVSSPRVDTAVVCGQCHGPTHDEWNQSKHKELITAPIEEAATNPGQYARNSRCVLCHSNIFRTEVYEKGIDISTLTDPEVQEFVDETVNVAPQIANCNTCHNPHAKTGNLNADGEEKQLRHKTFNIDTSMVNPGTTAAQFTAFDHGCGECHNGRGANGTDAKLIPDSGSRPNMHASNQYNMLMGIGGAEGNGVVKRNTAHAEAPGQCSKCHMPSARHTFTVSYDTSCSPCHTAQDAAARATSVKQSVLDELYALRTKMQTWAQAQLGDPDFWDYSTNVSALGKTPPDQKLIPIEVRRARHNYYFIVESNDYGIHNHPYVETLLEVANLNMDSVLGSKPVNGGNTVSRDEKLRVIQGDYKRAGQGFQKDF